MFTHLHCARNSHALAEDLVQMSGSHCVAQRRLREQTRRMMGILHVGNGHGRVGDAIVDNRVHGYGDAVLGKDLEK